MKKKMYMAMLLCSMLATQNAFADTINERQLNVKEATGNTYENIESGTSYGQNGGAIYNYGVASVINDCVFSGNSTVGSGGAIAASHNSFSKDNSLTINNSSFSNNISKQGTGDVFGGAIFVNEVDLTVNNTSFTGNSSMYGGAIGNNNSTMTITNSSFSNNSATAEGKFGGGAIYTNAAGKIVSISDSKFINNTASKGRGGAIDITNGNTVSILNSEFTGNEAMYSGAIDTVVGGADVTIAGSSFVNNEAQAAGAVGNFANMTISDTTFKGNKATASNSSGGGALFLGAKSQTTIENAVFDNNYSACDGGAIGTREIELADNSEATLDISNSTFKNNMAYRNGGAINNTFYGSADGSNTISIKKVVFEGNEANGDGGAIYNAGQDKNGNYAQASIQDSSFINNTAQGKGGAIFANDDLTISAKESDVIFQGNKAKDGNDIYMNKKGSVLILEAADDRTIILADGISGSEEGYTVSINGAPNTSNEVQAAALDDIPDSWNGTVVLAGDVNNANIQVQNGTIQLTDARFTNSTVEMMSPDSVLEAMDGKLNSYADILKAENGMTITTDISTATGETDVFGGNIKGEVVIAAYNPLADSLYSKGYISNDELKKMLGLNSDVTLTIADTDTHTVLTPLRWINTTSDGSGIGFAPTGNSYKDFNPTVMAGPVAAQLGGYLNQLNSYNEAFANMDMYMSMTSSQRYALKLRNKYALAYNSPAYDAVGTPFEHKGAWARPYATFESVPLKNGPKVSNVSWGSFFGAESELYELENGWDAMYGVYAGYNGSHQAYDGTSIYQNGANLGLVGMAYKGNLFTGLTVNVGTNVGEANSIYGNENFTMIMAGVASKTGYNFEFKEGKFIIQPSLQLAYTFVNTFDYTNAAGIRITSDPLNAIQVEPGIKFIANLSNGWQPYAGVSVIGNIMEESKFHANDASLPELSVKPYVKYGIGVRKTWGERVTAFFQTYILNGGRSGIGLHTGARINLGKK